MSPEFQPKKKWDFNFPPGSSQIKSVPHHFTRDENNIGAPKIILISFALIFATSFNSFNER